MINLKDFTEGSLIRLKKIGVKEPCDLILLSTTKEAIDLVRDLLHANAYQITPEPLWTTNKGDNE